MESINLSKLTPQKLTKIKSVSGGDINRAYQVSDGQHLYFLKEQPKALVNFFHSEATSLKALRDSGQLRVPNTIAFNDHQLLIEWIEPGNFSSQTWIQAGTQLAQLHKQKQGSFGFYANNYCGLTPQINTLTLNGYEFFAEFRLLHLMAIAKDKGLLEEDDCRGIEKICLKLTSLVPEQQAALIHGDLWSGNLMASATNEPVFIDPACYFGWPEADLAMTMLFGRFPEPFYDAYFAIRPQAKGFEKRSDIYNLYHLLNHLVLFGASYQSQVRHIINRWA